MATNYTLFPAGWKEKNLDGDGDWWDEVQLVNVPLDTDLALHFQMQLTAARVRVDLSLRLFVFFYQR